MGQNKKKLSSGIHHICVILCIAAKKRLKTQLTSLTEVTGPARCTKALIIQSWLQACSSIEALVVIARVAIWNREQRLTRKIHLPLHFPLDIALKRIDEIYYAQNTRHFKSFTLTTYYHHLVWTHWWKHFLYLIVVPLLKVLNRIRWLHLSHCWVLPTCSMFEKQTFGDTITLYFIKSSLKCLL